MARVCVCVCACVCVSSVYPFAKASAFSCQRWHFLHFGLVFLFSAHPPPFHTPFPSSTSSPCTLLEPSLVALVIIVVASCGVAFLLVVLPLCCGVVIFRLMSISLLAFPTYSLLPLPNPFYFPLAWQKPEIMIAPDIFWVTESRFRLHLLLEQTSKGNSVMLMIFVHRLPQRDLSILTHTCIHMHRYVYVCVVLHTCRRCL